MPQLRHENIKSCLTQAEELTKKECPASTGLIFSSRKPLLKTLDTLIEGINTNRAGIADKAELYETNLKKLLEFLFQNQNNTEIGPIVCQFIKQIHYYSQYFCPIRFAKSGFKSSHLKRI